MRQPRRRMPDVRIATLPPPDRHEARLDFEQRVIAAGVAIRKIGTLVEENPSFFTEIDATKALNYLTSQLHAMVADVTEALKQAEKTTGGAFSLDAPLPTEELRVKMGHTDIRSGKPVHHAQPDVVLRVPRTTPLPSAEIEDDDDEDEDVIAALEVRESAYAPTPVIAVGTRPTDKHKATGRLAKGDAANPQEGAGEAVFELDGGVKPTNPMPDLEGETPDKTGGIKLAGFIED